jgi:hypothetical protein
MRKFMRHGAKEFPEPNLARFVDAFSRWRRGALALFEIPFSHS